MAESDRATKSILEEYAFLGDLGTLELHQPGSVVVREGDPGDEMFIIKTGQLDIIAGGHSVRVLEEGEVMGEMALIDMQPRSATAVAKTDCELIRVTRDQFVELAQTNYEFFLFMMHVQAERLRRMNEDYGRVKSELDELRGKMGD